MAPDSSSGSSEFLGPPEEPEEPRNPRNAIESYIPSGKPFTLLSIGLTVFR